MTTTIRVGLLVVGILLYGRSASAQAPDSKNSALGGRTAISIDSPTPAAQDGEPAAPSVRRMSPPEEKPRGLESPSSRSASKYAPFRVLIPNLSGTTITWIAVVLILSLLLQTRPLISWLNLDALMLALAAIALAFRGETASCPPDGPTLQFWSYTILTVVCVYWLWRGVQLTFSRAMPARSANVNESAMMVLIIAILAIGFNTVLNAPLSEASRDGLAGGIHMAEIGKLPYGDLPGRDARSPLLYALHAGAVKIAPPTGEGGPLSWSNRAQWLDGDRLTTVDPLAARLVNGVLFVLVLAGVGLIGQRLHSVALGWTAVALFVMFPGTLESLSRSDVLLPTALFTWSLAFLTLPGVGPFLATLFMVFAGLAWPWAWLGLPVLLAFFIRRGWQVLAVVGAGLVGVAAISAMLLFLVNPTLPRADGALAAAGDNPRYSATLGPNGALVIEQYKATEPANADFKAQIWKSLLRAESTTVDASFDLPPATDASTVLFREVAATSAAREGVQSAYRKAVAAWPDTTRAIVSLRSVLECVWRPEAVRAAVLPTPWSIWLGTGSESASNRIVSQRSAKGLLGVLVVVLCWRILRSAQPELHQLLGALGAIAAGAMLASEQGATANWAWLLPAALAITVAPVGSSSATPPSRAAAPRAIPPAHPTRPSNPSMFASRGIEPRISIEK